MSQHSSHIRLELGAPVCGNRAGFERFAWSGAECKRVGFLPGPVQSATDCPCSASCQKVAPPPEQLASE
eukprot:4037459-Amphidinium_carterae.1